MRELPSGTITFLFSDIEGSTRLLQELGPADYGRSQDAHASIMRAAIAEGGGVEVRTEGDAFFVVFPSAVGAVRAAASAQRSMAEQRWSEGGDIRVRIGLHTGEGLPGGDDYLGIDVNRAARIAATGHGGQVVLSETTRALVAGDLPDGVSIRDLGAHRLKDIAEPQHLSDLVIEGLETEFPPLVTLDTRRTNLPAERTTFVGREDDIEELAELIDEHRLVTVTGPGGTGKTRLALKVAASRVVDHDGTCFVDLSAVREPSSIAPAIARALRIRERPGVDPLDALSEHLCDLEILLVLDNMEQLAHDASVVGALLDDAPELRVLATSRIPLRLTGEFEYQVAPLTLPDPAEADPAVIASSEAVRLFVERASAFRRGFEVNEDNASAIARIVVRLDGLPLALELASSKLRALDAAGLADRLEYRLPLLTGGASDAPARQRTLAETIRWSEEALGDAERRLFARLSVFAGGFTMEAAEAVCGDGLDVLDGLGTLVDRSLVRRVEPPNGSLRFVLLETIREYATARLAEADTEGPERTERRHAEYMRDLAERAEPHLTGERQLEWLATLQLEHENMRVALDHAERASDPEEVGAGLRTAAAVWRFWQQRGHMAEGRERLARLVSLPGASRRDASRALALGALGSLDYWLNDYAAMQAAYEEASGIAEELGDRQVLVRSLYNLAFVPFLTGHPREGIPIFERCLEVVDPEDRSFQARVWSSIGTMMMFAGDPQGGIPLIERALDLLRLTDERLASCEVLIMLANAQLMSGNLDAALGHLAEATSIATLSGSPILLANVMLPLAIAANRLGRHERAARLAGAWNRLEQDYEIHFPAVGLGLFGDPAAEARAALGDEVFEEARSEGFRLDLKEIGELLEHDPGGASP
jgi:predicted ATPase/class 3 adenylate cyclase